MTSRLRVKQRHALKSITSRLEIFRKRDEMRRLTSSILQNPNIFTPEI